MTTMTNAATKFRGEIADIAHSFSGLSPLERGELALKIAELLDATIQPVAAPEPVGEVKLGAHGKLIDWYSSEKDLFALPVGTKLYTAAPAQAAPETTLRDWLTIIHDNDVSLGDRLQRLSVRISGILRGDAPETFKPHTIREQCNCALDYERVLADHRRMVRELDVLLNGEDGAAKQASLVDIVAQVRGEGIKARGAAPEPVAAHQWRSRPIGGSDTAWHDAKSHEEANMRAGAGGEARTLYTAAPAQAAPYEPTYEMLDAARQRDPVMTFEQLRLIWWAMWKAMPAQAATDAVRDFESRLADACVQCDVPDSIYEALCAALVTKAQAATGEAKPCGSDS